MLRAAPAHVVPDVRVRAFVSFLLLLLLLSVDGVVAVSARAGDSSGVAAIRQRQLRAEASMRRADRQVARLERRHARHERRIREVERRLQHTIERRDDARDRLERLRQDLALARAVRDRKLRVHPDPAGHPRADRPALRHRVHRLQERMEHPERQLRRLGRRIDRVRDVRQARTRGAASSRIAARVQAREHAETVLGSQIELMRAIARQRAADEDLGRLAMPARGHISQGYGCRPRPRDSGCAGFHDGIDIAAPRGTAVRASASGVVAFAGWNPWDRGRRAYVVIIAHADGMESVYAHLKPVRVVRAGERVDRGERIGVVGMTGHTSGPHVHWEVTRDSQAVDPRRPRH